MANFTFRASTHRPPQLELQIDLGRTRIRRAELASLRAGAVIALDKLVADPVDVLHNGRPLARGEVAVLDGKLCVRITELSGSAQMSDAA